MGNRADNRSGFGMSLRPTMRPVKYSKAELEYRKAVNRSIYEVDKHLSCIFTMVMYDKFDWGLRKLSNCQAKIIKLKKDNQQGLITAEELEQFAKVKKIDINKKIKEIPMSQKLYIAGLSRVRAVKGIDAFVDSTLQAVYLLIVAVMKTEYKMSNENIYKLFDWMAYYIDSYFRKYTSDEGIVEAFKISEGIDIISGEKISEEERMALY